MHVVSALLNHNSKSEEELSAPVMIKLSVYQKSGIGALNPDGTGFSVHLPDFMSLRGCDGGRGPRGALRGDEGGKGQC